MTEFVRILKNFDDYFVTEGTDAKSVEDAEQALSLKFAKEYVQYLKECGVASADGHEFTGLIKSKRLNVVDVTETARKKNVNIPLDLYVVEELQIDGIIIWQSEDGKVFQTVCNGKPEMINSSLADYIAQEV